VAGPGSAVRFPSRAALFAYRSWSRVRNRCFSVLVSGAFAKFGKQAVLALPIRLTGEQRIEIDDHVFVGPGSWLQTIDDHDNHSTAIWLGRGMSSSGSCVISAVRCVRLEEYVLLARNVYISDHIHKYSDPSVPIFDQGVDKIRPVLIKRGAWIGQNVVVCPGVTIGRGAVIGANSVVNQDVPDFSVAVGSPARVVKHFHRSAQGADLIKHTEDDSALAKDKA
jgi:acetyltransferase-like isoleucine patch superfamily enzyme